MVLGVHPADSSNRSHFVIGLGSWTARQTEGDDHSRAALAQYRNLFTICACSWPKREAGRQNSLERNRECVKQCSAQHMAATIQSLHCELSSKQSQPTRQRQSVTYLPHTGQSPQVASLGSCRWGLEVLVWRWSVGLRSWRLNGKIDCVACLIYRRPAGR